MQQKFFIFLSLVVAYSECKTNYGSGGGSSGGGFSGFGSSVSSGGGGGYGGLSSFGSSGSTNGAVSYVGGGSANIGGNGPHQAAIETHRTVEVRPVNIPSEPAQPQIIEVGSEDLPVTVHFKSQSSRVFVQQTHIPGTPGEVEHTSSEDEPHRVVHEVVKPVIQEVREIIQPYRRLVQQIQPVIEQTHTIVAKGEPRPQLAASQVQGLGGVGGGNVGGNIGGYGGGLSGGSSGGSSYGGSGGQSSYSSRSGALLPSGNGQSKGQVVNIDNTGSGSTRIYSSVRNEPSVSKVINSYRSRARA